MSRRREARREDVEDEIQDDGYILSLEQGAPNISAAWYPEIAAYTARITAPLNLNELPQLFVEQLSETDALGNPTDDAFFAALTFCCMIARHTGLKRILVREATVGNIIILGDDYCDFFDGHRNDVDKLNRSLTMAVHRFLTEAVGIE